MVAPALADAPPSGHRTGTQEHPALPTLACGMGRVIGGVPRLSKWTGWPTVDATMLGLSMS